MAKDGFEERIGSLEGTRKLVTTLLLIFGVSGSVVVAKLKSAYDQIATMESKVTDLNQRLEKNKEELAAARAIAIKQVNEAAGPAVKSEVDRLGDQLVRYSDHIYLKTERGVGLGVDGGGTSGRANLDTGNGQRGAGQDEILTIWRKPS